MPAYMINLLLVFSGLLTGYLLWYRDRRNEILRQQSLKKDNDELHASLSLAHATHRQLNDRFQRQTSQLNVLQRLCDELNEASQRSTSSSILVTETPILEGRHQPTAIPTVTETDIIPIDTEKLELNVALENATAENSALQTRIENQESTINKIAERTKDTLHQQEVRHTEQIRNLEQRICSQADSMKKTDQHLQEIALKLDVSQKKLLVAESALVDSNSKTSTLYKKIENLKATCLKISQYESQMQGAELENQKLKLENQTLRIQHQENLSYQDKLSVEIRNLKSVNSHSTEQANERVNSQKTKELELTKKIESLERSNDQLQHERAGLLTRLANQQSMADSDSAIISFAKAMEQRKSKSQQFDAEHQGHLIKHTQRGMLFASPPKKPDNLKFISGITEILEARLNDSGIYSYKQILDWSEIAVTEFSGLLGIDESLITNTWKQQAEFLAQPKASKAAA